MPESAWAHLWGYKVASTFTVTRDKAGVEDIYFGTGTFTRLASDGTTVLTINKVNATDLPVVDSLGLFQHTYLEDILVELYELFTDAHIQTWYYQDEDGTILHGFGDVINQPADVEPLESFWVKDEFGTVIHGMGDVINK